MSEYAFSNWPLFFILKAETVRSSLKIIFLHQAERATHEDSSVVVLWLVD